MSKKNQSKARATSGAFARGCSLGEMTIENFATYAPLHQITWFGIQLSSYIERPESMPDQKTVRDMIYNLYQYAKNENIGISAVAKIVLEGLSTKGDKDNFIAQWATEYLNALTTGKVMPCPPPSTILT